jgi:hypothetical protein
VKFFTLEEIKYMFENKNDLIMPSAVFILKKYYFKNMQKEIIVDKNYLNDFNTKMKLD